MREPDDSTQRQSLGHVGALFRASVPRLFAGGPGGCDRIADLSWTPQTLTAEQNEMVDAITEIMTPTMAPGKRHMRQPVCRRAVGGRDVAIPGYLGYA